VINKIKTLALLLLATGLMVFGPTAHADSFTVELSTEFSGATPPEGSTPWLLMTVDDGDTAGSLTITIEAVSLTDGEFISAFYMNYNPDEDVGDLGGQGFFTFVGDINVTNGCAIGNDAFSADGAGVFDIFCDIQNAGGSGRWTDGETLIINLTGPSYVTASDFNFMNVGPGGNCCWTAAAHVQGIGDNDDDSGWIGGNNGKSEVAEPGSLALFGLGLTLMGVATRRRKLQT